MASEFQLLVKDYVYVRSIFAYLHLLMNIYAMRMSWLIIFCSRAVWALSRNSRSAIVSDISNCVPVRLLIF